MRLSREQLVEHVSQWSTAPLHLDAPWLPKFAYHFTDIKNAVRILETGELLSRSEAVRRGLMEQENASTAVIAGTLPAHQDFARLYFRPRTPTQFNNEGIRPPERRGTYSAHCPVPVFLLFDLVETLSTDGVLCSNGNMAAKGVEFSDRADFFTRIPFDRVYHDGRLDESNKANIKFHRHAEVLARGSLSLQTLRAVACRSVAERESLLTLLKGNRAAWDAKVGVAAQRLYFLHSCFVESVSLDDDKSLRFNLNMPAGWAVRVRFELRSSLSSKRWTWADPKWTGRVLRLNASDMEPGMVTLHIEDCLAYVGHPEPADAPF